jgi:4-amino-4-deoxy-L-arabinose transferase-like glycosyltransferase
MKNLLRTSLVFSLFRNSSVQFIWWVIFFPGFYSGDSFGAVAMAKTGDLTNSGTASWALYVRVFSLFGHAFPILAILSGLILVYGVTQLTYSIFEDKPAAITSFILTLTPIVAGMGITLWHDIPFTSGLLLVVAFFVTWIKYPEKTKSNLFLLLIPGALLASFKPNGLPTLIIFGIISLFLLEIAMTASINLS